MSGIVFYRGEQPLKAEKLNQAFSERVSRLGDTMQGILTLWRDPTGALDAATKRYVDNRAGGGVVSGDYLPLSGGTLTGPLVLSSDPLASMEAATKRYVDNTVTGGGDLLIDGGNF